MINRRKEEVLKLHKIIASILSLLLLIPMPTKNLNVKVESNSSAKNKITEVMKQSDNGSEKDDQNDKIENTNEDVLKSQTSEEEINTEQKPGVSMMSANSGFTYRAHNGNAIITGYTGTNKENLVIPKTIVSPFGEYPVTGIDNRAFEYGGLSGTVTLPDTVTSIGDSAFSFNSINLKIYIPYRGQMTIGSNPFVYIHNLVIVGYPNSFIESYAMSNGHSFEKLYDWIDNGDGTATITEYNGPGGDVEIPNALGGLIVTKIGEEAFSEKGLSSIVFPTNLEYIGKKAFSENNSYSGGNLKKVTIPGTVKIIDEYAFQENDLLEEVILEEGVREIKYNAFENTAIEEMIFPESLELAEQLFENIKIRKVTVKNKNTILNNTFRYADYNRPEEVTIIGHDPSTAKDYADANGHSFLDGKGWVTFIPNGNSTWSNSHFARIDSNLIPQSIEYVWSTSTTAPSTGWQGKGNDFIPGDTITHSTGTGNYYLHIRGEDFLGYKSNFRSNAFRLDNTAPTLNLSQSPTSHTNGNVTITARGSDNHSGVRRIRLSGGSWTNGSSMTHTVSSNGTYTFQVEDNAGNTRSESITVNNIDKTLPTVSLSQNGGSWAISHSTRINASDSGGSGLNTVQYRWTTSSSFPTSGWTSGSNGTTVSTPTSTGNHYLHVRATDRAGNVRQFTSSVFRVDRTNPTITITPSTTSYTNQNITLTVKGSDSHSGVRRIRQSGSSTWHNGSSTTFTVSSNGTYKFYVEDNAGNITDKSITVSTIDKTAPSAPSISGSTSWQNSNQSITITHGTDSGGSGVDYSEYRLNGGSWTRYSSAFTISTNGETTIQARTRDKAGNISSTASKVIKIDKQAPTISVKANTTSPTNGNVTVTVTGSDSHSGVNYIRQSGESTQHKGSSATFTITQNGTYTFRVYDNAGNVGSDSITINNIDKTNPTISLSKNGGSWSRSHSTNITASDSGSGVSTIEYRWTTSSSFPSSGFTTISNNGSVSAPSSTGNHYLHVRAKDRAGNIQNFTSNVFRIDNSNPTHVSHSITGHRYASGNNYWVQPNDEVKVTFRQRDEHSGNDRGYIRLIGNSQDVRYYHSYSSSTSHMTAVNNDFSNTNSVAVTQANRTENTNGYGTIEWTVQPKTHAHNYTVQYYYRDSAGNTIGYVDTGMRLRVDGEAPSVTFSPNSKSWTNSNVSVSVNISDSNSGVKRFRYRTQNGDTWSSYSSWIAGNSRDITLSDNGRNRIHIQAEDNVGNVASIYSDYYYVDKVQPTISVSPNGKDYAKSHSTMINVNDSHSGVKSIEYRWTTSSNFPTSGFTSISNGKSVSAPSSTGNHYLHVKAIDNANNLRNFTSNVFRIDNTNPNNPTISAPTSWANSNVTVDITGGTDAHSGIDRTEYRINNGSWSTYSNSITISTNGKTTIDAQTIDKVGNVSGTVSATVRVDKVNPALSITPSTTNTTHEDVILTAKGSDAHSGVKRIRLPDNTWVNGSTATYNAKQNGTYEFLVEDNAGNRTTESIRVSVIDKTSSFEKPSVSSFDTVTLSERPNIVTTNITPIIIKDWREGTNKWRLDVSANQMKLAGQSFYLPKGTMKLKAVSSINRKSGSGSMPTKKLTTTQVIDDGQVTVVESSNARGEYDIVFPSNALELIIDPTTAKIGTYESTISWDFINAP